MKKILHLFSDRSHSALWSRYLRMLTLIALLAFGSHGVWGEEAAGTAAESWAPSSESSKLTGSVHVGTNMSIDLISTWQSVSVIDRYAIKKGEGAKYPDPQNNDYFTIDELNNNLSGKSYIKIKANKTGTIKVKGLYGDSSYKIVVGRSEYNNGAVKFFDDPIQKPLVKGTPTEFEFMVFENRYYYVFVPEGGDAVFQEIKFFAAHGRNVALAKEINNGVVTLEVAYPYIANTIITQGNTAQCVDGYDITIKPQPDPGYLYDYTKVSATDGKNTPADKNFYYSLKIEKNQLQEFYDNKKDMTFTSYFVKGIQVSAFAEVGGTAKYSLNNSDQENGSLQKPNQTFVFTATPYEGYTFSGWYDRSNSLVSPDKTYTASSVKTDLTLTAKFEATAINEKRTITVDGKERTYWIYAPGSVNGKTNVPVIFSLHGRQNDGADPANTDAPTFKDIADTKGVIIVYPQGRHATDAGYPNRTENGKEVAWNSGYAGNNYGWEATGQENADTKFIQALVDELKKNKFYNSTTVDPKRFYLCGFSMGGMMTYAIATALNDKKLFAAYASAGGFPVNEFHLNLATTMPVPFYHVHGKGDDIVIYDYLRVIKENMLARYGCSLSPVKKVNDTYYDHYIYRPQGKTKVDDRTFADLEYVEINSHGHSVHPQTPGGMWDFFKNYTTDIYNSYSDKKTPEWSWDMMTINTELSNEKEHTEGHPVHGWSHYTNNTSEESMPQRYLFYGEKKDNSNVYPAIQLQAGKHIIYAKYNMAPSEENAYLTLKNNISGVEIVARKLKNNSGSSTSNTDMVIAYEFETEENGEFSVYVGRGKAETSCTSLSIYKSPTTAVTESDESIDNSNIDITGYLLNIDFEELKRNSSDTKGTKTATLLKSGDYGMSCVQPSSGYEYYYANRLERKNDKYHYDVVANDKVFENYFQNMPHADIYERTSGEDFMRIMIPEGTLNTVAEKGTITIGFWVNANLAVDRGLSYCQQSMFYLAGDKFNGWNTDHPDDVKSEEYNAYMFNITCNGGISGYMRYDDNGETKVAAYAGGTAFGGFCDTEIDAFYKKNHYMDGNWHYITFQMYDNLSRYNMYVDGLPATLGGYSPSNKPEVLKKGICGLKSIVLGGLNARNSEWSYDVAFAYDDIVIYDRVLSQAEIKKIISEKKYTPSWNFKRNLSNANLFDAGKIKKSSIWTQEENGVYSLNKPLSAKASLTYDDNEEIPAFKGLSFTTKAANQIKIDTSNGTLNVSSGAAVCFKNIPKDNYLRFTTKSTFSNSYSEISLSGVHDKYLECPVTLFKAGETSQGSGYNGNPTITMNNDVVIYSILRTDKQFAQMWCEKAGKITKTYSYNSSTPATNDPEKTSMIKLTDLPEIILFVNGTKRDLPSPDWKFKYSSSAPQVANVDQNKGYVTITGIPGSAVITVELVNKDDKNETVHGNDALYERTDRIFASYEIINRQEDNTFVVSKGEKYSNNRSFTLTETTDEVTKTTVSVTLGGWKYGTEYQGQRDDYSSAEELSGVDCFGFSDITTENERFTELFKDGKSISTNGTYAAKSESWVKNVNESGLYKPNEANTITNNTTPWTIPCRGTHIKVEPEYPGIMSVYVLQKGCVTERGEDNKPISVNLNQVYITDETGKSIREVICDTKTRVADQIWKNDGRARAEYTYNDVKYAITPGIFNSFRNNIEERQRWAFLDNWDNPGMTGHVFCTDYYDDKRGVGIEGHVLISTGIVKYTFNVVPGKTYYIFSNNSPLGFAGFSFDKNKHLNIVEVQGRKYSYLVANNNNPTESKEMASDIKINNDDVRNLATFACSSEQPLPYYDEFTHSSKGDSKIKKYVPGTMAKITYDRAFSAGVWSSICLPYSISNRQMKEQFGEGTQVVLLNKIYDKDGHGIVQFIWHANQDIIAGYPYLILPTKTTSQIVTNSTIELKDNPLFSVTEGQKTIAYDNSDSESGYVFKGNFKEEEIPVGSYVLNTSGKLARVGVEGLNLKPFRAYLRNNAGKNAKLLKSMAFSGWDDIDDLGNTTSIDEILEDSGIFTKGVNVYDLNGVLVRKNTHTIQGLPKGIYVVNGKKYVVK